MKKKGISLVALVVTIIVLIILTGAVVATFMEGGIIDKAKQAVIRSDIRTYQEILTNKRLEKQIDMDTGNGTNIIELTGWSTEKIQQFIPEFKEEYEGIIELKKGEILAGTEIYKKENKAYQDALIGLGIIDITEEQLKFANIIAENDFVYSNGYITGIKTSGGSNEIVYDEESITTLENLVGEEHVSEYTVQYNEENSMQPCLTTGDEIYDLNGNLIGIIIVNGDTDGTGWIDMVDTAVYYISVGSTKNNLTNIQLNAMDINGDGYITNKDWDYYDYIGGNLETTIEELGIDGNRNMQIKTIGQEIEINME